MKLSTKYLLIIVLSILIFPVSYLGVNLLYYFTLLKLVDHSSDYYYNPYELRSEWTEQVDKMNGRTNREIKAELGNNDYRDAVVTWLDSDGKVMMSAPPSRAEQTQWTVTDAIALMKEEKDDGLFTVVTYLAGSEDEGYIVLQIPDHMIGAKWDILRDKYTSIWFGAIVAIWIFVIFVSWLFFNKLRRRLVAMQRNMEIEWERGIPETVVVEREDEIGQLQHSFNRMVKQLKLSQEKEQHEAELRKTLIANLSHDLRTPLTIIRGHAFKLYQQPLSEEGEYSLRAIQDKVDFMGELIDNLSSFTLLSAGKLPMKTKEMDIRKIIRTSMSAWYTLFEEQGFEIIVELEQPVIWVVDEVWLKRVLDNLLQNIMRHAAAGQYASIRTVQLNGCSALIIQDRGPGMEEVSKRKGIGIGLSIVTIMLEQMNLEQVWESGNQGTTITIRAKEPVSL